MALYLHLLLVLLLLLMVVVGHQLLLVLLLLELLLVMLLLLLELLLLLLLLGLLIDQGQSEEGRRSGLRPPGRALHERHGHWILAHAVACGEGSPAGHATRRGGGRRAGRWHVPGQRW